MKSRDLAPHELVTIFLIGLADLVLTNRPGPGYFAKKKEKESTRERRVDKNNTDNPGKLAQICARYTNPQEVLSLAVHFAQKQKIVGHLRQVGAGQVPGFRSKACLSPIWKPLVTSM